MKEKKYIWGIFGSIFGLLAIILMFTIDNRTLVGATCLLPATFYYISYFIGEKFDRDSPYIHTDGIYFWLNVYSKDLEILRTELGLEKTSKLSRPPSEEECFHITIGNLK